ncbi:hypothetical protein [Crateriforma spongiae]|uniref:hypothetical protein n=1 Tax=Crateriforma spongiae TaxID=2724528 RepID=UPI001446EF24|nr:hypothetical protein [Crateriforma spongiae]
MAAEPDILAAILAEHLSAYREMSHSELAARLELPRHEDHLDVTDGATPDGTAYTIETNILWDDCEKRHIRVMSDLSTGNRGCLFGFIPIFTPDVADGFIMSPDGKFIDE